VASILETLDLNAPVSVAYALWSDVENWPRFLSHVERVEKIDETRFKWWLSVIGAEREFTAELTEVIPEDRIAWKTTDGAHHAGVVTFHRLSDATSRVALQIEYEPEGFLERLGALTNLVDVLANYDLGEFKTVAEAEAAPPVVDTSQAT
jgi:uncharacterized membrane protein